MAKGKKAKAFKLFAEGKTPSSPEVKALGLKGSTRYTYHDEWKKSRAAGGVEQPKAETVKTPSGEVIGGYDETKLETPEEHTETEPRKEPKAKLEVAKTEEEKEPKAKLEVAKTEEEKEPKAKLEVAKTEEERSPREKSEVSVPAEIVGFGIPIRVGLSLKSLALYQIASTTSRVQGNGDLSLGKFIDECIEDFFVGRGSDLGLVKLEK